VLFGHGWSPAQLQDATALAALAGRRLFAATDSGAWQRLVSPSVALQFQQYYTAHDGFRVMGRPIAGLGSDYGLPTQYFEKGRLEDHSLQINDPNWRFMYGLLVDELQNHKSTIPIGGDVSSINYSSLHDLADAANRVPAPAGFTNGISANADGSVFIPYNAQLNAAAGHNVPGVFWAYINRADLFPAGWLHDIGLPMTEPVLATVDKGSVKGRQIWVQAFQRTILTYDPANPADWQVERANVGSDYYKALK
jgi:hypothetical protein